MHIWHFTYTVKQTFLVPSCQHLHVQDKIKMAAVSLMTDYLDPGADSEILHGGWLLVLNYAKAWESYFQGHVCTVDQP